LLGASKSIQRYRVRERKWQTKVTLARGVYWGYTPLHTNGKDGTTSNNKGLHSSFICCISLENGGFSLGWIQILLLKALNILLNNKPG